VPDLWLVRHAEARAPDDVRLPGPDLPLTERGRGQARRLTDRLAAHRLEAVYCSDARRARETAEAIAAASGAACVPLPELREIGFGAWAGRTYAEIVAQDPTAEAYFRDFTTGAPPGGERVAEVADRVLGALRLIRDRHPSGAVVVGHAGSLRLALASALGMPLGTYWRLRLDHAGLSTCGWPDGEFVVETLNDRAHLCADRCEARP
jgi:broad specificity phosphatase PhoE